MDSVLGTETFRLLQQDPDCRSAEVNYSSEGQHAVHITVAMLLCLLLPVLHENLRSFGRG